MPRFDLFVVLAGMRTGSNALEEAINLYPGLRCHGEAFNPGFIGHQGETELFGLDLAAREADPMALLRAMQARTDGLAGFRFFHDHDPRVLAAVLPDPRVAKIVLTRAPLESYVSLKIARRTGQWKLTDAKDRKTAKARFDAAEFEAFRAEQEGFRARIRRALQETGQAPFQIDHSEIGEGAVLDGLARFLGVTRRRERPGGRLKRQNPEPLERKVENPEDMAAALGRSPEPNAPAEPARGPGPRRWVAASRAPLLYLPFPGGPAARVEAWLSAFGGGLEGEFTRKTLRQWKNRNKDARAFAVVTHPVLRAHRVFCRRILPAGPGPLAAARSAMRRHYGVPLPEGDPGPDWDARAHRAAFLGMLRVAAATNAGQTGLRADPVWASQHALLAGAADLAMPDMVLRESALEEGLAEIARQVGRAAPALPPAGPDGPVGLADIYDDAVEQAVRELHNRDYMAFGFRRWSRG
jgi:hypothetical protein